MARPHNIIKWLTWMKRPIMIYWFNRNNHSNSSYNRNESVKRPNHNLIEWPNWIKRSDLLSVIKKGGVTQPDQSSHLNQIHSMWSNYQTTSNELSVSNDIAESQIPSQIIWAMIQLNEISQLDQLCGRLPTGSNKPVQPVQKLMSK